MSTEGKPSEVTYSMARRFEGVRRSGGILDRIVEVKAKTLADRVNSTVSSSKSDFAQALSEEATGAVFENALNRPGRINVIAEIKRKSPSKGILREDFHPVSIAESYSRADAAALSVLTEEEFFGGSLDYLSRIRQQLPKASLLRKDFIFDLSQIDESKTAGASALLLIVAILEDELLADLLSATNEAGLAPLVEVHDEEEMERAALAGARIIGVNNRDLRDFSVSIETSIRLSKIAPPDSILVSESGINTPEDIARLAAAGFRAFLVGEHFMRAPDPGLELTKLIAGAETMVFAG